MVNAETGGRCWGKIYAEAVGFLRLSPAHGLRAGDGLELGWELKEEVEGGERMGKGAYMCSGCLQWIPDQPATKRSTLRPTAGPGLKERDTHHRHTEGEGKKGRQREGGKGRGGRGDGGRVDFPTASLVTTNE